MKSGRRPSGRMRNIPVAVIVALSACAALYGPGAWGGLISLGGHPGREPIELMRADEYGVELAINLPMLEAEGRVVDGERYVELGARGFGVGTDVGEAGLPVMTALVEVPHGVKVRVAARPGSSTRLELGELGYGARVMPVQPPAVKLAGAVEKFVLDEGYYGTDAELPEGCPVVGIVDDAEIRGHRVVAVRVEPVSYNPVRGIVECYPRVEVEVSWEGADGAGTRAVLDRYASRVFDDLVASLVVNPWVFGPEAPPELPVGYLVITHDQFASRLAPLVEWKWLKGFEVTVTQLSEIVPPTAQGIHDYIYEAYTTWPVPPTYVLLVGDAEYIPTFTGTETGSAADLYFATLVGTDYFPDVALGRLPVGSAGEIDGLVEKIAEYEQVDLPSTTWMDKAVFMASLDNYQVSEGTHNFVIENYLEPHGMTCFKVYARLGGNTQGILDNLNEGRVIANYSGHGSTTAWANPAFSQANIMALANGDMYPFVISNACLTGQFTVSDCFGETWVNTVGKGALAFWGSSTYTYWDEDDVLEKRMYRAAFEDTLFEIGRMTDQALIYLYEHYSGGGMTKYYFECYNVFGDPSTDLFTLVPEQPSVEHPATIPMGPSTVTFDVTRGGAPVRWALVSATQGEEIREAAYTDAIGQATLTLSPSEPDTITIVVTGHNLIPYLGCIIPGAQGAYVSYHDHLIDDDMSGGSFGNGDGLVNPGETIEMPTLVKNWGSATAPSVTGELATGDPLIAVTDWEEEFGTLAPGDSAWSADDFDFTVAPETPDAHVVQFTLTMRDANDSTWVSAVNVMVYAPDLQYVEHTVDDSGGNGNGIADPGETVDLTITIANAGGAGASGIWAELSTDDPLLTLLGSGSSYPDLDPGENGSSVTPYVLSVDATHSIGELATFVLEITADGEYAASDTFQVLIGREPVLIWDADPSPISGEAQAAALLEHGLMSILTGDLFSQGEIDAFQAVFVNVGIYSNNYTIPSNSPEALALESYVDDGGNLYLEGGDLWYYDPLYQGGHDFGPLFGIDATSDGGADLYDLIGQDNSLIPGIAGMSFTYNGENSWIDHILPIPPAELVFRNASNSDPIGVAKLQLSGGHTIGTSFEFGGLVDGQCTKSELMAEIIDFFEIGGAETLTLELVPDATTVEQGGTLGLTAHLTNSGETMVTVEGWTEGTLPNGNPVPFNPLVGPNTITLGAGQTKTGHFTHPVPQSAPLGVYSYDGKIGTYPDVVITHDSFSFEVVPSSVAPRR